MCNIFRATLLGAIFCVASALAFSSVAQDATNDSQPGMSDASSTARPNTNSAQSDARDDGFDYGWLGLAGLVGLLGLMPRDRRPQHDGAAINKAVNR